MMMPANPKQSLLESLPTELLEQIFLECLNINLPLASSHLGTALSSTSTKMTVVLKVFPYDSFDIAHYLEMSRMIGEGGAIDTERGIGELQSRILACRWMTWDFLKLCMEMFVVKTLVREFRIRNLPWQEGLPVEEQPCDAPKLPWHGGTPVKESVVRDFVHDVFALKVHLGIRYKWELDDCEYTEEEKHSHRESWKELTEKRACFKANGGEEEESEESEPEDIDDDENFERGYQRLGVETMEWNEDNRMRCVEDGTITPSLRTYSWGPADGTPRISIGIGPRNGLVILGTRLDYKTKTSTIKMGSVRWRCLCCQFETNIPVKLLHGPWTQDQLSFLQALVEGGAAIDTENDTHKEIAKKGLTEAISGDDYRAVDLLMTGAMESQYSRCQKDNYFEPSFVEARFVMEVHDDSRDWVKSPMERMTLGVKPDTEHLKVAVIERECRRKIVKRLLWARFSDIDRADPAVVDWAEKRKEKGDRNGQWLLDQLMWSGNRDREEREYRERSTSYDCSNFSRGSSETRSGSQSEDGDELEPQDDSESNSDSPSVSDAQSGNGD